MPARRIESDARNVTFCFQAETVLGRPPFMQQIEIPCDTEKIDLSGLSITGVNLAQFGQFPRLHKLALRYGGSEPIDLELLGCIKNLSELNLGVWRLQDVDLTFLHHFPDLKWLELHGSLERVNLAPLGRLHHLQYLDLHYELSEVNLGPLSGCSELELLSLAGNKLTKTDLAPLAGCRLLKVLEITHNPLSELDLAPLCFCTDLAQLYLQSNRLEHVDLTPLADCPHLNLLDLENNQLQAIDMAPLSHCHRLKFLYLGKNHLQRFDLSPLAHCRLKELEIQDNWLTLLDITPLFSHFGLETFRYESWSHPQLPPWRPKALSMKTLDDTARLRALRDIAPDEFQLKPTPRLYARPQLQTQKRLPKALRCIRPQVRFAPPPDSPRTTQLQNAR